MGYFNFLKFIFGIVLFFKIILNLGYKDDGKSETRKVLAIKILTSRVCWLIYIGIDYILLKDSLPIVIELVKQYI